jgi:L-iditol 2-dehydrogenase
VQAAVLKSPKNIEIKEVDDPKLSDGDILIKVDSCAICGTDVKIYRHGYAGVEFPLIIGHELAGTIVQSYSDKTNYKIGDRVTINPNIPCGVCYYCQRGLQTACDKICIIGIHTNGGFADYIKIPGKAVDQGCMFQIPEKVTFEEATLIDPASCAVNAAELSNIKPGDFVVVIGAGPVGCLNVEVAKNNGASKTILIDISSERLEQAQFTEADMFINSTKESPVDKILKETNKRGADVVIVACASGDAQEKAIKMVAKRGNVNLFGGLPKESPFIKFDSNLVHYKESYVIGTHGGSNRHCGIALDMISSGRIKAGEYISSKFKLSEFSDGLTLAEEQKGLKIIIKPNC